MSERESSTELNPRVAATLAYLAGPFSGALILWVETRNEFVRFHARQSIIGLGGLGLALIVSYIMAAMALFVSATAVTVMLAVSYVLWVVLLIVWALCLWKAWAGERWRLPLAGDFAESRAAAKAAAAAAGAAAANSTTPQLRYAQSSRNPQGPQSPR
jgi:uncharacterized membrane protein